MLARYLVSRLPCRLGGCTGNFHTGLSLCVAPPAAEKHIQPVVDHLVKAESAANKYEQDVENSVSRWEKSHEIYYGKERDFKNFPTIKFAETSPKIRMGVFPDYWFQPFYNKTGVTGPYMFMFGSFMFLINKEIWVFDPHFLEFTTFVIMSTVFVKLFGPRAKKFMEDLVEKDEQELYYNPINEVKGYLDNTIKTSEVEMSRATAVSEHVKAKEENIALQLEAAYRERLQNVYRTVHRRLDYHVERENTRKRYIQHHMVNWVVDHVVKGITPTQEKETLAHCINELKRLAQTSKVIATA
ncbi:unnamed protein product [Trichobilharzia szidati]|nr:unnamed protein product [Trichobilharzia szidati]